MVVGSNPTLSNVILGLKNSFMYLKTQKVLFICPQFMPKEKKFKKQKINSAPLWTTVIVRPKCGPWLSTQECRSICADKVYNFDGILKLYLDTITYHIIYLFFELPLDFTVWSYVGLTGKPKIPN